MIFLQATFLLLLLAVPLLHADSCPMMHCPTHQITYSDELAMCHEKSRADRSNNFAEGIGSFIAMHLYVAILVAIAIASYILCIASRVTN